MQALPIPSAVLLVIINLKIYAADQFEWTLIPDGFIGIEVNCSVINGIIAIVIIFYINEYSTIGTT